MCMDTQRKRNARARVDAIRRLHYILPLVTWGTSEANKGSSDRTSSQVSIHCLNITSTIPTHNFTFTMSSTQPTQAPEPVGSSQETTSEWLYGDNDSRWFERGDAHIAEHVWKLGEDSPTVREFEAVAGNANQEKLVVFLNKERAVWHANPEHRRARWGKSIHEYLNDGLMLQTRLWGVLTVKTDDHTGGTLFVDTWSQ